MTIVPPAVGFSLKKCFHVGWLITKDYQILCINAVFLISIKWSSCVFIIAASLVFKLVCVQFCVCLHTYICISMHVFSGILCAPFFTSIYATCVLVCQLDLNFSTACLRAVAWGVFHLSVSIYMHMNVCGGKTFLSHPLPLAKTENSEGKKMRGGGGEFNQPCVKIARGLSWSSRERERQQPAEEKKDVCSYAHQQEERGDEGRERGEIRRGEEERRSVFMCLSANVRVHKKVIHTTGGERGEA